MILLLLNVQLFGQRGIDTSRTFNIGGIRQFVTIKGDDRTKPLLLFLHGGPGGSLMGSTEKISNKLQEHFVIVQWDQRETGETLKLNRSFKYLTLDMFYNDTRDLIDSLLRTFGQTKLYLAGYSWGSGLGFHIAGKYPELLHAYLAISPVIDQRRSDSISLALLKKEFGKKAKGELSQVKIPFENADQLYYHRKWLGRLESNKIINIGLPRAQYTTWGNTWFDVWMESCKVNLFESLKSIECPVYFFAGDKDYNTNFEITREYYRMVKAPKKAFFLFEDTGHAVLDAEAGKFQGMVIDVVLAETREY